MRHGRRTLQSCTLTGFEFDRCRNWVRSAKLALHYDNATYIFLLALHAGVEPVSYDTATYPLPVAATRRRTLYRSCTLTGFEFEQMPPSVFEPSALRHRDVHFPSRACDHGDSYPFTGRCDTATYSLPVVHLDRVRVEQMPQSVFNPARRCQPSRLSLVRFAKPHTRSPSILVDELDAGGFQGAANG